MSTRDEIASGLRADILAGRVEPGAELRQEALAERFAVSRMPVRDALGMLANERLVTLRPNRGARVVRLTEAELEELYDLRVLLEADALRRAVPRMTAADLDAVRQEMRRCEVEAEHPDFPDADWRFHVALYTPAGRPRQTALIGELRGLCRMHAARYDALRAARSRWRDDHRAIVDALGRGDADGAAGALETHLRAAGARLLESMAVGG